MSDIKWERKDENEANGEGWTLFPADPGKDNFGIGKFPDSNIFKDDQEALKFVLSNTRTFVPLAAKAIYFLSLTLTQLIMSHQERVLHAKQLEDEHKVTFEHDGTRYFIEWSDCNEGWMIYYYPIADKIEDHWGQESFEVLHDEYSEVEGDGGLCTGSALDAVEFFQD